MSEEKPSLTRTEVREFFFYLSSFVVWGTVWLQAIDGKFPNPLPSLAKDWIQEPVKQSRIGYYKHIKVLGSGDRSYLLNLNTDRGVVRNVRTTLVPGSFWKNVTINSEGKVTRRELSKSRDTGCLESAVIMRRTGIVKIGGMQVTDAQGNFYGNVDLVNCEKKNKD